VLLFVEIRVHGAVDMSATFESFKSCIHLLKSDSRPLKSVWNAVTNAFQHGLIGFIRPRFDSHLGAEFFGHDAAFYGITSISFSLSTSIQLNNEGLPISAAFLPTTLTGRLTALYPG